MFTGNALPCKMDYQPTSVKLGLDLVHCPKYPCKMFCFRAPPVGLEEKTGEDGGRGVCWATDLFVWSIRRGLTLNCTLSQMFSVYAFTFKPFVLG